MNNPDCPVEPGGADNFHSKHVFSFAVSEHTYPMTDLSVLLGSNLRAARLHQGRSIRALARRTGISPSYISELEAGKKFPGDETLSTLLDALDLRPSDVFRPPGHARAWDGLMREFGTDLFGFDATELSRLLSDAASSAAPMVRTWLEIGQTYSSRVESFLFAALRSYQRDHRNHFPDLERAAWDFRMSADLADADAPQGADHLESKLEHVLVRRFGIRVGRQELSPHPDLNSFRSVSFAGPAPVLYVNNDLLPSQRAFILAKEIGSVILGVERRTTTSPWLGVDSFEQVLDNYRTSYFAGAVIMPEAAFTRRMTAFLARPTWSEARLVQLMNAFSATPEMFFYRLGQIAAEKLHLDEHFFMRLSMRTEVSVSKLFNMTSLPIPKTLWTNEHFCRKWAGDVMLRERAERRHHAYSRSSRLHAPTARAQRVHLVDDDVDLLMVAMSRPLQLGESGDSAVVIGFPLHDSARAGIGFRSDPKVPRIQAGITCERCSLSECAVRAAPPSLRDREILLERHARAVSRLAGTSDLPTECDADRQR